MPENNLILEIQHDAIQGGVNVATLLRKAKVAAVKLVRPDAIDWIDAELDGYNCAFDELPVYRRLHGTLKAYNPYQGLVPIIYGDLETDELLTRSPVSDGVGSLQTLVEKRESGGHLSYSLSGYHRQVIMGTMEFQFEPKLIVSHSQIENILQQVVSLVLNWSLELEKAGILGEGMSFTKDEKKIAQEVTQHIMAQNIGSIGNTSDSAQVTVSQSATAGISLDEQTLAKFLKQVGEALPMLDGQSQARVRPLISELENEQSPDRKASILRSLQNILEGASGNIAAQGMLQMIASILPH